MLSVKDPGLNSKPSTGHWEGGARCTPSPPGWGWPSAPGQSALGSQGAWLMHLSREVLSERVLTIEREMAFESEGPFCSQVRSIHLVTCGSSQPVGQVLI